MVVLLPKETLLSRTPEFGTPDLQHIWGEHFYQSLMEVEEDPSLMNQAMEYSAFFDVSSEYTPAIALMIRNKIVGPEADEAGLSNIGRHSILTGKASEIATGQDMLRLDQNWKYAIDMASYGHEYMKGLEILRCSQGSEVINGHCRHKLDNSYYEDYETNQPAIFQATSMFWPYKRWIDNGMIGHVVERTLDSIVGPELLPDNTLGEDKLQPWYVRTAELQLRKAQISEKEGIKYNYPAPAFVYLEQQVMPALENYLFNLLSKNNPELVKDMSEIIEPDTPFTSILLHQAKLQNMPVL